MNKAKKWYQTPRLWFGGAAVVVLLLAGAAMGLARAVAAPEQPFPYSHKVHIESGIQCLYCHPGALRGATAGLPTLEKCQGCHKNLDSDNPGAQAWSEYAKTHETISWVPVAIQPDFVYFSHRPHLAYGINCEQCHGNVGQMTVAEPQRGQDMGWCLDCHKKMAPEKTKKLIDCATCHK